MSRLYRHDPLFVLEETDRTCHLRLFLKELIILQSCPPVVKGRWDKNLKWVCFFVFSYNDGKQKEEEEEENKS